MNPHVAKLLAVCPLVAVALACSSSPAPAAADSGGAGMSQEASVPDTSTGAPPAIVDVLVTGTLDDDTAQATLTVDVSDPDGLQDIAGGKAYSPDKKTFFGAFTQLSAGTFALTIGWQQLSDADPVVFGVGESATRDVLVEFADAAGHVATATQTLKLSCAGCLGQCHACGSCTTDAWCGVCASTPSPDIKTCTDFCGHAGMACYCAYGACNSGTCVVGSCGAPCAASGCACGCS